MGLRLITCLCLIISYNQVTIAAEDKDDLKNSFESILAKNQFRGTSFGLMSEGRLVVADGTGTIRGHQAHASTLLPILGVSKLFTAVAILQLLEDNEINLSDRVFGNHGILYYLRPENEAHMDRRLRDITIRHLLYHTAGWDARQGPIYDPMLNAFYVRNGFNVVNIAREMDAYGILTYDEIIRFMVTQPLHHDPGMTRIESNFGYILLGRIIEQVTDLPYEAYIKEYVLDALGMWHTRMGPHYSDTYQAHNDIQQPGRPPKIGYIPLDQQSTKSLFDIVPASVLDACLGWHSNVYDLSRFFTDLSSGDGILLDAETVNSYLLEPGFVSGFDGDMATEGVGLVANDADQIWFKTFHPDVKTFTGFYHQGTRAWDGDRDFSNMRDITIVFIGLSDYQANVMTDVLDWVSGTDFSNLNDMEEVMDEDLADVHIQLEYADVMVAKDIDEHHIESYLNALREMLFAPTWLHAYRHGSHTKFVVISERTDNNADLDFSVLIRDTRDRLILDIADEIKQGYQLCFVHSYHSVSHEDSLTHIALMRNDETPMAVRFDIASDLDSYSRTLDEGLMEGCLPVVQSVDTHNNDIIVTYLLRKSPDFVDIDESISYTDLSLELLMEALTENKDQGYILQYLDTFLAHGQSRFSAIFRKQDESELWLVQSEVTVDQFEEEILKWKYFDYIPHIITGYTQDNQLYFVVLFKISK